MPAHYTGLPFALAAEHVVETHASLVLLAGSRAYKLKKPVKYPFLDYSTLELRTHFLLEELRLNRRFSPDIYLGIAEVRAKRGKLFIGPTQTGENGVAGAPGGPPRGDLGRDEGELVDYCVVMKRIADECWLPRLVADGRLPSGGIGRIVAHLAAAFDRATDDNRVADAGLPKNLKLNTVANIAECRRFVPRCLGLENWTRLDALLRGWFEANPLVFIERVRQGRIHDGHGDLKPGNIAFVDDEPVVTDCIEFSENFRALDALAEFGFLATGLEALGHFADAAEVFDAWRKIGRDDFPQVLRRYYQAHLACVMGKVTALRLDGNLDEPTQTRVAALARHYFALADFHAREPHLVVVGGVMGCGKSTLAAELSRRLGWTHVSSDVTRKQLAGIPPSRRLPASAYTRESAQTVYKAMNARVGEMPGVILDGQFPARFMRQQAAACAQAAGGMATLVLCDAPDAIVSRRMRQRMNDPDRVSDATEDLLAQARAEFQPVGADEGFASVIQLDTRTSAADNAARVQAAVLGDDFQPQRVI